MYFEPAFFQFTTSIAASVFVTHAVVRWRNSKSRTSVFAQDSSLEDVGLSALSSFLAKAPVPLAHGKTELRPTWGLRLIAPMIAILFLAFTDFTPLWNSLGVNAPALRSGIIVLTGIIIGYTWFMLLFVQRVVYDSREIQSHGISLRCDQRSLQDLVDIRVHDSRPSLVLSFATQDPMYIPKFLSHREAFIAAMQEIIERNSNKGMEPAMPGWRERAGL